jgi:Ca2+-transporting ATPase
MRPQSSIEPAVSRPTAHSALAGAHAIAAAEVCRRLGVDPEVGLGPDEATRRLVKAGPNRLPQRRPPSPARLLARQFTSPLVALLLGAGGVSLAIGESLDALVIVALVIVDAALGYVQERRAEEATEALRDVLAGRARVLRGGRIGDVLTDDVVVGDVLVLAAGDRVAADARILSSDGLEVDESVLTGESLPVAKRAEPPVSPHAPLAEHRTKVFAGTLVVGGAARAVVCASGADTEVGRIAAATTAPSPRTPLQQRLDRFAGTLLRVAGIGCLALAALSWAYGTAPAESVLVGVSLAVAAVPEGLPVVVTVTLALGMRRMAERGAVVRRLHAVETLGSTTVICSDKTGTLTENRLTLERVWTPDGSEERLSPASGSVRRVLAEALLASGPLVSDPLERALEDAAIGIGLDPLCLRSERRLLRHMPFDSRRKRTTAVHQDVDGTRVLSTKGAPEVVAGLLQEREREEILLRAAEWAADGARVLLVGRRVLARGDEDERELEPVGLLGFADPPRQQAAASVRRAREAGVRTLMVTGDHPATAWAIARATGVAEGGAGMMTGAELDRLDGERLARRLDSVAVVARVEPVHKLRIVEALQRRGEVVAMTGDGVNDVPALAAAHIGVAMGRRGSDAAVEAADMVLTDDDYSTIVVAIEHGRGLYDNILRFLLFLLSANAGEVLVFVLAVPAGLAAPLSVLQILVVNLLTDGPPAIALGIDPPGPDVMRRPPRPPSEGVLAPIAARLTVAAAAMGAAAFAAFAIGRADGQATGQTMAFATLVFGQLAYVATVRGEGPFWSAGRNPTLWRSVGVAAALGAAALAAAPLREMLGLVVLTPPLLVAAGTLALVPPVTAELHKVWLRRRRSRQVFSAGSSLSRAAPGGARR